MKSFCAFDLYVLVLSPISRVSTDPWKSWILSYHFSGLEWRQVGYLKVLEFHLWSRWKCSTFEPMWDRIDWHSHSGQPLTLHCTSLIRLIESRFDVPPDTEQVIFSERELRYVRYMLSPFLLSVCRLSVCLWRWCALLSRLKFSAIFFTIR